MDMSEPRLKHSGTIGINPQQVKRQETFGISVLLLAVGLLVAGLLTFSTSWLTGFALLAGGVGLGSLGVRALKSIPDLLASADESF